MASIGNPVLQWHTAPGLQRAPSDAGFTEMAIVDPPYISKGGARRWYVAAKRGAVRSARSYAAGQDCELWNTDVIEFAEMTV